MQSRLLFLIVAALLLVPPARAGEPFMRGMTVSCQTWGIEWGTPEFGLCLDRLKALGVTHVAIHPYAQIGEDGSVRFRAPDQQSHLLRAMAMAKERGVSLMMIPHLAYWGTKFKWRGEIWFPEGPMWDRFFKEYGEWITGLAELAAQGGAEIFVVGHEYDHMHYYEAQWRKIIADVRAVYSGKVTYHANWSEYEKIPFWDALDYIAIGAYFPVSYKDGAPEAEIQASWRKIAADLGAFARKQGKRVLFTEIGYNESAEAARKPWDYESGGPDAKDIRRRTTEAALALEGAKFPELAGVFFWKWFPDIDRSNGGIRRALSLFHHENFDMRDPDMVEVLQRTWAAKK